MSDEKLHLLLESNNDFTTAWCGEPTGPGWAGTADISVVTCHECLTTASNFGEACRRRMTTVLKRTRAKWIK